MTDLAAQVADAYVWGLPLVIMQRTCATHGGVGRGLVRRATLATAADRTVVAPNNDTLYASGWFDLRDGDLTVEVGPMDRPDRYWSVMLLDAHTHVQYLCRRLHGTGGLAARVTLDPADPVPGRTDVGEVVRMGTPTVWVLARVVVDGPDDLPAARGLLDRITVDQPGAARPDPRPVPAGGFLARLRTAVAVDPPAAGHPPAPEGLGDVLAAATDLPDDVVAEGIARGRARVAAGRGVDRTGNGWGTRSRGADFGDDVGYRASFAQVSLAGHRPAENRSYTRPFDGSAPGRLRFPPGGEPPVDGFWSLCVYGPDLFLVDNPIDRYSVGDRTPGLRRDADGGLTIHVGHRRPRPADGANWLPAPDGPCFLTLRAYEGRAGVVDATWFPPDVVPDG